MIKVASRPCFVLENQITPGVDPNGSNSVLEHAVVEQPLIKIAPQPGQPQRPTAPPSLKVGASVAVARHPPAGGSRYGST